MRNTEIANNGVEFYSCKLFEIADKYISERLKGDVDKVSKCFRDLIFYAASRIEQPDTEEIERLDDLFSAYVQLCTRYNKLPTVECFSFLAGVNRSTFDGWNNGRCRSSDTRFVSTYKKWLSICKSFVVDELSNAKNVNPNLIFVAKSAYFMRETTPIPVLEERKDKMLTVDQLPRLDGSGDNIGIHEPTKLPCLDYS